MVTGGAALLPPQHFVQQITGLPAGAINRDWLTSEGQEHTPEPSLQQSGPDWDGLSSWSRSRVGTKAGGAPSAIKDH